MDLPTTTPLNAGPLFVRPHTGPTDEFLRRKIVVEADGASLSFAEWKVLVELGLDRDFEALIDYHYAGKPLPFDLGVPALRLLVPWES
jgi:hypothetical protein